MNKPRQWTPFWSRLLWQAVFLAVVSAPALALGLLVYDAAFNGQGKSPLVLRERELLRDAVEHRLHEVRRAAETLADKPLVDIPADDDPRFTAVVAWRQGGRPQLLSGSWSGGMSLPGTPGELLGDATSRFVADGDELIVLVAAREPFLLRVSMPWLWQSLSSTDFPACSFMGNTVTACSHPFIWRVAQWLWDASEPAPARRLELNLASADGPLALRVVSLAPPPLQVWLPTPPDWTAQERFIAGALLWLSSLLLLLRTRPESAGGNVAGPVLSRGRRVRV